MNQEKPSRSHEDTKRSSTPDARFVSSWLRVSSAVLSFLLSSAAMGAAVKTELVQTDGKWQLLRDGKPYFVKGVGGDASKAILAEVGGNSFRTWGADHLDAQLDEARKLGLTVAVGIWLEHERHGFDYGDEKFVTRQFERARQT